MKRFCTTLGLILILAGFASAGDKPLSYFPVSELKPGMKAVGKTIFQGGTPEEFGVEILGVLQGIPNHNLIGPQAIFTFVVTRFPILLFQMIGLCIVFLE